MQLIEISDDKLYLNIDLFREKFKNSHESCQKFRNSQAHFLISEIANASHENLVLSKPQRQIHRQ